MTFSWITLERMTPRNAPISRMTLNRLSFNRMTLIDFEQNYVLVEKNSERQLLELKLSRMTIEIILFIYTHT